MSKNHLSMYIHKITRIYLPCIYVNAENQIKMFANKTNNSKIEKSNNFFFIIWKIHSHMHTNHNSYELIDIGNSLK